MKRPAIYVTVLAARASQKSILLTDQLTILIVPFSTLALWLLGVKMSSSIQEVLAMGVAMTVIVVVMLRLIAASFLVWKEDQVEKERLKAALESEVSKPDRLQRELARTHVATLRNQLGALLASQVSYAELRALGIPGCEVIEAEYAKNSGETFRQIRDLINSLSYDVPLRVSAHELFSLSTEIIAQSRGGSDANYEKLQTLKKLTFRIIYKAGRSELHDLAELVRIENVLGKQQFAEGPFADLQRILRENPNLLDEL